MRNYKVNSINVNLGGAIKYSDIPANKRGHKMDIRLGLVDESGRKSGWRFTGKIITPLGHNAAPALKSYVEGCINATDGMFREDTINLVYDVLNDHNLWMSGKRKLSKYCYDGDKIVVRAE